MRHAQAHAIAALAARAAGRASGAPAAAATGATRSPVAPRKIITEGPPPAAIANPRAATPSLLPMLAAWRRALHASAPPSSPGRRGFAAAAAAAAHPLPVAPPADGDDDDEAASSSSSFDGGDAHARRLRELQQQPGQQQIPRRRQLDLSRVPMLDIKGTGGCSSASASGGSSSSTTATTSKPVRAAPPPLDWREVVRRARAAASSSPSSPHPLTDLHGRAHDYLRISLTERCNLRCSYCMPPEGVALTPSPELLTPAEVQRLARLFVRAGVTKIRLTGGEPTVRRDLADVVAALAELQGEGLRQIALTSNGVALERQLPRLRAAGLTHLNVSLDTLSPRRFERLTRRPADAHARVLGALDAALELGFGGELGGGGAPPPPSASAAAPAGVKLNVVVVRGVNDDEVEALASLTRAAPLNVRYIEYMPFDGNAWGQGKGMVPYAELRARADAYAARALAAQAQAQMQMRMQMEQEQPAHAAGAAGLGATLPPFSLQQQQQQQQAATGAPWPLGGGGGGGGAWGGPGAASAAPALRFAAAAAYHGLAAGSGAWEQQQHQQQQQQQQHQQQRQHQEQRRRPSGLLARAAAEADAALPLTPPPHAAAGALSFSAGAPLLALRRLDDHPSEVAKNFRAPGHAGTLSFVTSMTSHFCGGCTRLRLLADGALKVCLFGANEVSLRDAARGGATDDELLCVVGAAVRRKKASHAGMHEIARTSNRPMITIGG